MANLAMATLVLVALLVLSTGSAMTLLGQTLSHGSSPFTRGVILIQRLPLLGCCVHSAVAIARISGISRVRGQKRRAPTCANMF